MFIFLFLGIYPMLYEIYLGLDWDIHTSIFSDPIFIQTLWNTVGGC